MRRVLGICVAAAAFAALSSPAGAQEEKSESIRVSDARRAELLSVARTWVRPAWIDDQFRFLPDYDLRQGPELGKKYNAVRSGTAVCRHFSKPKNGKSPKTYCNLLNGALEPVTDKDGSLADIKVRLRVEGNEGANRNVFAETAATRLLWSLGFGADRVFPMKSVTCVGCKEAGESCLGGLVAEGPLKGALRCDHVGVEKKMKAVAIEASSLPASTAQAAGFGFGELRDALARKRDLEGLAQFDALRLLAGFLQHADSKPENHRLTCVGKAGDGGQGCDGTVLAMIQDLGVTFGEGGRKLGMNGMSLDKWKALRVWKGGKKGCQIDLPNLKLGFISIYGDGALKSPEISEEGRQLLAKLLTGFASGPEGEARVRDLFAYAGVEHLAATQPGSTPEAWAAVFQAKVAQIVSPTDAGGKEISCRSAAELYSKR